jgi:subtilisin-like proprotein convertase family protein
VFSSFQENLMKRLWLPVAVGVLAAAGCSTDAPTSSNPDDDDSAQLSPSVIAQMQSLLAEKAARSPAQRKISSSLLYEKNGTFQAAIAASKDPSSATQAIRSLNEFDAQGRVLVDVLGDMSQLNGRIEALGGQTVDQGRRTARAWVPLDRMEELAASGAVRGIHPAFQATSWRADKPGAEADEKFRTRSRQERVEAVQNAIRSLEAASPTFQETIAPGAVNVGAVTSAGDGAHNATRARNFFGTDGAGVKIGVLSDSDDFLEQSIITGDLPENTFTVPGEDGRPGSGEGTAMLQIVHDLAPGADLFFATAFRSPESFADNIRRLRFEFGCDVIIDDVIYFFESPYTDDIIAQAVNDVTADGAMFFSSAGNSGNFDDGTSGTWEGDFRAAGSLASLPDGTTVHNFGGGVISNRIELSGGPLILHWSDPGTLDLPLSSNDYDVFVLDNSLRNVVLAATDIQAGSELPFEFLGFFIPAGFRVVIAANPGAEVRAVRTMIFGGEYALSTSGSTYGHAVAVDAFGVAAVDAAEALGGQFTAGQTTPVELFSADGPRRIFNRPDGTPINADRPGRTFASGGGNSRAKPDIAAADGVATTLPAGSGLNPFFGTSAAAPHAGAIAALIKAAVPGSTPARIRSALIAGALDIEGPGADRNAGRGIVSAFTGLQRAGARAAVSLAGGNVAVTPLGGAVVNPGTAAQVNVQLVNSGGAAATGVTATLSSSSPDVLILQGTSSYPNVGAESAAVNNAPFAFFVSPLTICGSVLPFTLTVNFTGNGRSPLVFNFGVQTGSPSDAPTVFSFNGPPVAIPDASAVGANIPLNVDFPGSAAKVVFSIDGATCNANAGSATVGVDHTWVGDLTFQLRAPSGRTVTLFSAPGGVGNSGNNFCQTVLDDGAANSIQNVVIGQAPFTGSFRPLQSLGAFAGENATGAWTLHAQDDAFIDTGSVRAFSLAVSGFACTR